MAAKNPCGAHALLPAVCRVLARRRPNFHETLTDLLGAAMHYFYWYCHQQRQLFHHIDISSAAVALSYNRNAHPNAFARTHSSIPRVCVCACVRRMLRRSFWLLVVRNRSFIRPSVCVRRRGHADKHSPADVRHFSAELFRAHRAHMHMRTHANTREHTTSDTRTTMANSALTEKGRQQKHGVILHT